MLGNSCLLHCNRHALTKLRQLLFFLCIRFILCGFIGIFEEILKFLPSIFPHFLAGYLKYSIVAGNHCLCGIINVLLPGRTQQTVCTKESIFISLSGIAFKSCLMISMVGMIAWWSVTFLLFKILLISGLNMIFCSNNRELKIASITFCSTFHVIGKILAVCSWISY